MISSTFSASEHFQPLIEEIKQWQADRKRISLWWRDDDAQQYTHQLKRLLLLSSQYKIPITLAVIPNGLDSSLIEYISPNKEQLIHVAQHGFQHKNHAPKNEKKQELGFHRNIETVVNELLAGKAILKRAFKEQFVEVIVPPWNRIAEEIVVYLKQHQYYIGLSRHGSVNNTHTDNDNTTNWAENNIHVDILNFKGSTHFMGEEKVIDQLVNHLQYRRKNDYLDEVTGLMTHHLVHDEASWHFLDQLCQLFGQYHETIEWRAINEIFASKNRVN